MAPLRLPREHPTGRIRKTKQMSRRLAIRRLPPNNRKRTARGDHGYRAILPARSRTSEQPVRKTFGYFRRRGKDAGAAVRPTQGGAGGAYGGGRGGSLSGLEAASGNEGPRSRETRGRRNRQDAPRTRRDAQERRELL